MDNEALHEIDDCSAPNVIEHFIGQERVKKVIRIALESSWMDGIRMPSMLFTGPAGVGKSQMAAIICKEVGNSELVETLAQNLKSIADVQAFLLQAKDRSVLLIDEAEQMGKFQQVCLYKILENGKIFVASGTKRRTTTTIKLPSFTLICATNWPEALMPPLLNRFKLILPFTLYSDEEMELILRNRAKHLRWQIDDAVYATLAKHSRGTPRTGLRLMESVRRICRADGADVITTDHLLAMLEMEGIDELSLTPEERQYMSIVGAHDNLARVNVIATIMAVSSRALSQNLEPFLIRTGLLTKDARTGCRTLTKKGLDHIQKFRAEDSE